MASQTMQAVIFNGPFKVSVEQRPIPKLQAETDVIVEVSYTALCGSELHVFRGIEKTPSANFIMGHEFTGIVKEIGSQVRTVNIGDKVVCPFTVSCGTCFYCLNSHSSRCTSNLLFGSPSLDGAQAEFVRVPLADGTVLKAPDNIRDDVLVLMADIFPTGYFGARNGLSLLSAEQVKEATVVVVGCGPVGLCAVISALGWGPKKVFAIDGVVERVERASALGAEGLNFNGGLEEMKRRVNEVTEGRGADVVIEVVGSSPALKTAFELIRPFGIISSIGVHNGEVPWTAAQAYDKNLRVQMGRCPVRSIFPEALKVLEQKQDLFGFMFEKVMPLSQAVEGYDIFNKMQVQKVVFKAKE